MNREKFILSVISAVIGAALMFVALGATPTSAIEGWTPVNLDVATALAEQHQPQPTEIIKEVSSDKQEANTKPSDKNTADNNQEVSTNASKSVNINTADIAELQNIPGIGEKKAQTIIDYRNQHGAFKKVQDLTKVKGIGEKSFQKMKPYINIGS